MRPIAPLLLLPLVAVTLAAEHGAAPDRAPSSARETLVLANKILATEGLTGPFGHVSLRLGPTKFLIAAHEAGPWIDAGDLVELDTGLAVDEVRQRHLYLEVFIHSEMYKAHPDVGAVVHTHSPYAIALGTLKLTGGKVVPTTNPGSNLGNFVPVFPSVGLVQTADRGREIARSLQGQNGLLLRGHGAVVVGPTVEQAVLRAIYLELEARIQMMTRQAGEPIFYRPDESDLFKGTRAVEHAWEYFVEKVRRQDR